MEYARTALTRTVKLAIRQRLNVLIVNQDLFLIKLMVLILVLNAAVKDGSTIKEDATNAFLNALNVSTNLSALNARKDLFSRTVNVLSDAYLVMSKET